MRFKHVAQRKLEINLPLLVLDGQTLITLASTCV